jgi:hypothetical protein
MAEVLGDAARNFSMDDDNDGEEWDEDFDFRSDVDFRRGGQYNVRVRGSLVHQCVLSWHLKSLHS